MKVRLERELTEPSFCRKMNMLVEPEPADSFGKASEPLSQICPMLGPAQTCQMWEERYRAVAVAAGAMQSRSAEMWGWKASASDDCAIMRRFYLPAAGFWKRAFPVRLNH
ncbi:hypothetical protein [Bradyrhizobium tunisiense]|uniref:hypothetical protein n=1 Tax=Bradyrhizobium tunisiense TaxID=3278709 RepID=UPI0035D6E96D